MPLKQILILLAAAFILSGAGVASAQEALDRRAFDSAFLERARAALPQAEIVNQDDAIRVSRPGLEDRLIFLDQAYRRYVSGEPVDDVFASILSIVTVGDTGDGFSDDIAYILVRPTSYIMDVDDASDPDLIPATRPLAGDLLLFLGQDHGHAFSYPPRATVQEHADEAAVWDRAARRTIAAFGEISLQAYQADQAKLYLLSAERDDLGASLLIDDAVWETPAIAAVGDEIAVLVFRNILVLADAVDPVAVASLRTLMADMAQNPTSLTNTLIVRRQGQWQWLRQ